MNHKCSQCDFSSSWISNTRHHFRNIHNTIQNSQNTIHDSQNAIHNSQNTIFSEISNCSYIPILFFIASISDFSSLIDSTIRPIMFP